MATEKGIVTHINSKTAWVEAEKSSACEGCSSRDSCHLIDDGSGKMMKVEALNPVDAKVGDRIMLSFETESLMKISFLLYIFPIICMFAGAFTGQMIASAFNINESALSAFLGILFLAGSLFFVKSKGNKMAKRDEYKPRIIKIL